MCEFPEFFKHFIVKLSNDPRGSKRQIFANLSKTDANLNRKKNDSVFMNVPSNNRHNS